MSGLPSLCRAVSPASVAVGLIFAASGGAPVASADPYPPGPGGCGDGPWGARVQGAPPGFEGGDRGGVYLWHDNGFHLRVTHRNDQARVYAGTITSPTPMHLASVSLEVNDRLDLSADGRTIWFAFVNYGHDDGADFTTDCADSLVVGPLTTDDVPLPTGRIYLGANEIHPENNPLTIHRHDR
jgi:hypothetical protein